MPPAVPLVMLWHLICSFLPALVLPFYSWPPPPPPSHPKLTPHHRTNLDASLLTLHRTATTPSIADTSPGIPETLMHYVENGRNPDIYTREFVELVRRMNQLMRGKLHAFGSFRDVLAHEMEAALPEVRDDVRRVVEATGGVVGGGDKVKEEGGQR